MARALARGFGAGCGPVMLRGSDVPDLPAAVVSEAREVLAAGRAQVVLGPSPDGGYYLVGLSAPQPALFQGPDWSSSTVLRDTRSEKRDALQKFLGERNIGTGIHYPVPNHQQPGVTNRFQNMPRLPKTEQAVKEILSLPIHGEMTLDTADKVCDAIAEFYGKR